jgi:hypothetical chaperone protein
MRIGLDFGTTNSGAAVYRGGQVHLFPLDPAGQDPTVVRSALYITRDHQIYIGREAIDHYYSQNVGRPSRMVRERVGEVEMTMGDVGSVKGYPVGPTTFVREVYTLVDELTPGRLLYALKSGLATGYEGTTIFGRHYPLDQLIAHFLREIRGRVEVQAGEAVTGVVLGRPVHFVEGRDAAADRRAEERLRRAALEAGFEEVAFELEPVAAAIFYELGLARPQNALIFDLGGGTLDVTVIRLGERGNRHVFGTGGLAVAGDTFDRRIIGWRVLDQFGRGSTWGDDGIPFPNQYTDALLDWQALPELLKPETLGFLKVAQMSSSHPKQLKALESLLVNNYAIRLYDEVERAKIGLSDAFFETVQLHGDDIDLWQPITRAQFETAISAELRQVERCLLETLAQAGLGPEQIDVVVRTGGSAQIPCLVALLGRLFSPEKIVLSDAFSSVTAGLAVAAAGSEV